MTASFNSQKNTAKFSASRAFSGLVLTGLLTAMGGAAMAQTPTAPATGMQAPEATRGASHADGKMGYKMHNKGHRDPAKMQARMVKRMAEMKAKLNITAAQEPAWTAFTTAMKPPAGGMGWRQSPEQRAEMAKLNTPERIDKQRALRNERMTQRSARADQRGEATKVFYSQLSAQQKSVFDTEHRQRAMHRGGQHGGELGAMHKG